MPPASRLAAVAPTLLAVLFFGGSLYATRNFIAIPPDTAHQLTIARSLVRGEGYQVPVIWLHTGLMDSVTQIPDGHGILWPFVQAALFAVLSEDSTSVRVHGLIYLTLIGVGTFVFARRLFGVGAGLVAMILVFTNVNLFLFSVMAVDDISFCFFFLCTAILLHSGLDRNEPRTFWLAGLAACGAMLAKGIGFFMPLVFLSTLLLWRSQGARVVGLRLSALSLPFAFGAGAYFLRNYISHGGLGFRFTPMEWMYKAGGLEGTFGLFDPAPTMGDVYRVMGLGGMFLEGLKQLALFLESTVRLTPLLPRGEALHSALNQIWLPAVLPLAGLIFTLILWRRQRAYSVLTLLTTVGLVIFVSFLYHFELRYFAPLVPLAAISISSAWRLPDWNLGLGQRVAVAVQLAVTVAAVGLSVLQFAVFRSDVLSIELDSRVCPDSYDWIRRSTAPTDRVLALNPWHVAWFSERESVVLPSGGMGAIEVAARHYDIHWVLAERDAKRPKTSRLLRRFGSEPSGMTVEPAYQGQVCRVFRIDWN
ncbi:MAG: glycosyltransferase family 39 protein [Proteobacteria bacterium]|nr:glycosyltransferase family 39 protein [Pseudomonadota bacterium]